MQDNKTLGQIAIKLQEKAHEEADHTVAERIAQTSDDYWNIVLNAYQEGRKKFTGDFYIEMCMKYSKLFWNVNPQWLPMLRYTCPTPMFEQSVFRYNKEDDALEYLWTVPDIHSCSWLIANALNVPDDQKELLSFVVDFKEGNLYRLMKKLNKEDSIIH